MFYMVLTCFEHVLMGFGHVLGGSEHVLTTFGGFWRCFDPFLGVLGVNFCVLIGFWHEFFDFCVFFAYTDMNQWVFDMNFCKNMVKMHTILQKFSKKHEKMTIDFKKSEKKWKKCEKNVKKMKKNSKKWKNVEKKTVYTSTIDLKKSIYIILYIVSCFATMVYLASQCSRVA